VRALIVADLHANAEALRMLPDADVVLCAGDVAVYGPHPEETIAWLRSRGAYCIRGDEDDAVAAGADHVVPEGLEAAATEMREWTRERLKSSDLAWLAALPPELELTIDGCRVALVHAYPGDLERYLGPNEEELSRTARAFPRAQVVVTAHTHRRGRWHADGREIVNPGSVGQPAQAGIGSFLLLESGRLRFGEVHFDPVTCTRALATLPLSPLAYAECELALLRGTSRPTRRLQRVVR
jgi:predicted phosphodiesterase